MSAGLGAADAHPDGRDGVRPIVLPFTRAHLDLYEELRSVWRMMAWGGGHHHDHRPSALGGRHARADVVHDRAADARNRYPFGARRAVASMLLGIFGRAMRQLSIGLAVGSLLSTSALSAAGIGLGPGAALLLIVAAVITIVAAFAALGPARRSLRLPTVDALRVDG